MEKSPSWYLFWKHEGIMKSSWGSALWEAVIGYCWRRSLSSSWSTRIEGVKKRNWGLAPWTEPKRGSLWECSAVAARDPGILGILLPWANHQEWQQQWRGASQSLEDKAHVLQKEELEKWPEPFGGAQRMATESQTLDSGLFTTGIWIFFVQIVSVPWLFILDVRKYLT